MKQDKSAAAQALSLAAGWCVCCLLGYLLLRQLTVLTTGWYLQHWLAGPGAGAGQARYERRAWLCELLAATLPLLVPVWAAVRRLGLPRQRLQLRRPRRGLLLPAALLCAGAGRLANLAAAWVGGATGSRQEICLPQDGAALLLAFLTVCLAPALLEELLFRGVLQGLLRPGGVWAAIWGQGILFALLHKKLGAVVFALPAGLLFGWVAEVSGSLTAGTLLHFCNNTAAFVMLWASDRGLGSLAQACSGFLLAAAPIALLAGAAGLWRQRARLRLEKGGASPLWLLRSPAWMAAAAFLLARALLEL